MADKEKNFKRNVKAFFADWKEVAKKRWWIMLVEFGVLAIILLADLLTKEYIAEFLQTQNGLFYELMPGFINLQYTENTGAGFGMFSGNTVALTVLTTILCVVLAVFLFLKLKENMWLRISIVFIIGGGIGNIVDRIGLGYVRDFIQFAFWENFAIFNIADCFVTVGAFMLIIVLIVMLVQEGRKNKKAFEEEEAQKLASGVKQEEIDPLDAPININPMLSSQNTYTFEESDNDKEQSNKSDDVEL